VTRGGPVGATADDPLQTRVVERLRTTPRPQPAQQLRDALHVRKADLLAALHALVDRGLVARTEHGWVLATHAD
jgi:DNA-binding MarR family transcriptional regulator